MLLGAAKFHLVWRARLGLEPRLCGCQLATRSDELFKQVLPDAVKAGDFRRIRLSARRHSRLELLAQGGRLSPERNEFLKLVRTNAIQPLDFHARRLRGPARFSKLTSLIRRGLVRRARLPLPVQRMRWRATVRRCRGRRLRLPQCQGSVGFPHHGRIMISTPPLESPCALPRSYRP